ncbi:hypothetical protein PCANC_07128 [Puccinia coronata f. sp. avenae]|uniref:Uncharacterized protein n=1 Tax=Puccinia coronata f. sp. avenae TaxID=200324 RepID=A0A2N5VIT4_9BASI|nr:hypothetical protein PCANC_07128 [Puccinia coronata f. sp. avenae]
MALAGTSQAHLLSTSVHDNRLTSPKDLNDFDSGANLKLNSMKYSQADSATF